MKKKLIQIIRAIVSKSGLGNIPVRVNGGFNKGARWTFFPWTSYWRGDHEPENQALVERLSIQPGDCCWDLGAHYGFFSIAFATRVGPSGQVVAFEPNIHTFKKLARHKRLNRLDQLILFNAGASEKSGVLELLRYDAEATTVSHFAYSGEDPTKAPHRTEVPTHSMDDLVDAGRIRDASIIKIDVEGHGSQALAGSKRSIARSRPIILMGVHCEEERQAVLGLIRELSYSAHDVSQAPVADIGTFGDVLLMPQA